jgi:hypothetical protein
MRLGVVESRIGVVTISINMDNWIANCKSLTLSYSASEGSQSD